VVQEFGLLCRSYNISNVQGDRYGGEWPREAFRRYGISYKVADKAKSELYQSLLALLNSRRIELLDNPRLINQLTGLERRTSRAGRDSIDHAPGGHDDLANAVAGLAALTANLAIRSRHFSPAFAIWTHSQSRPFKNDLDNQPRSLSASTNGGRQRQRRRQRPAIRTNDCGNYTNQSEDFPKATAGAQNATNTQSRRYRNG
jgi:hypothetical protein